MQTAHHLPKKKKKGITSDFRLTEESLTLLCTSPEKVSSSLHGI